MQRGPEHYSEELLNHELYKACTSGNLEKAQQLIDLGADVNHLDRSEEINNIKIPRTMLACAARNGHANVLTILLAHEKINASRWSISEALIGAALNGHKDALVQLLEYIEAKTPASYKGMLNIAMCWASRNGHIDLVRFLIDNKQADPACSKNKPLEHACENGQVEMVRFLLTCTGVNPSSSGNRALQCAIAQNHLAVVAVLLQYPGQTQALEKLNPDFALAMREHYLSALSAIDCLNKKGLPNEVIAKIITRSNPIAVAYRNSIKLFEKTDSMKRIQSEAQQTTNKCR